MFSWNPSRSLRFLGPAVIATAAVALGFQGWMLAAGHRRALELMSMRAANRAQATAHQVQGLFKQADLLLLDIREHLDPASFVGGPTPATARQAGALRTFLRVHMAQVPAVMSVHVVAPDGHYVYSSSDSLPAIPVADRSYFQEQRDAAQDRSHVSSPLRGRDSGQWGIYATRRLKAPDGRFAGVLFAVLDAERLGAAMQAVDRQQWVLALYDQERRLVARSPEARPGAGEVIGGVSLDPLLGTWAESRDRAVMRGKGLGETESHLWAVQPLEDWPLATVAGFSEARALAQWRRDLQINLAVAALLVLGCGGILVLYRRHLRAQEDLHESEAYFRALFDASPEAIAVVRLGAGGEAEVVDANSRYQELFALPTGEQRPPWELAPPRQADGSASAERGRSLCEASRSGGRQRLAWQCLRADGTGFEAELTLLSFRHGADELVFTVVRDLTELRTMEEMLRQAQKLDALGQLAGGVAHDFNNMLSAILASAETLLELLKDEGARKLGRTIISASERAGQLTRKLLAFARKDRPAAVPTDVHQVVWETLALLERTIDPRVQIRTRLEAPQSLVVGDASQLQNALLNLAVNARDAMPEGGRITFSTRVVHLAGAEAQKGPFLLEPGAYLEAAVADTGHGIPAAHLARIFEPFYTTKEAGKGTGLGLAAVFGAAAAHRGAVTVASTVGEGSTFTLHLPLAASASEPARAERPRGASGGGRVLVVDDEAFVRTALVRQLEFLGYQGLGEEDPRRALEVFRQEHHTFRAVLLDLVMPGISGRDVAAEMRRIDPDVPILLMSGSPAPELAREVEVAGLQGYLQKPFGHLAFGEALERVCGNPVAPPR